MRTTPTDASEAAIFARLFEGQNGQLSQLVARKLLDLTFTESDQARMEELAQRNQRGRLTAPEREELTNYVKVGDLLAILPSKARQALTKHQTSARGHDKLTKLSRRIRFPCPLRGSCHGARSPVSPSL